MRISSSLPTDLTSRVVEDIRILAMELFTIVYSRFHITFSLIVTIPKLCGISQLGKSFYYGSDFHCFFYDVPKFLNFLASKVPLGECQWLFALFLTNLEYPSRDCERLAIQISCGFGADCDNDKCLLCVLYCHGSTIRNDLWVGRLCFLHFERNIPVHLYPGTSRSSFFRRSSHRELFFASLSIQRGCRNEGVCGSAWTIAAPSAQLRKWNEILNNPESYTAI